VTIDPRDPHEHEPARDESVAAHIEYAMDTPAQHAIESSPATHRMRMPQWVQLVCLPLAIVSAYLFSRAASHAVVSFLIAGLISLLLAPLVRSLAARGVPRLLSVLVVLGAFATVVIVLTFGLINVITDQAIEVRNSATDIGNVALDRIDSIQGFVDDRGWNVDVRDQGVQFVDRLEERSTELSGQALDFGREFVTVLAEAAFNLVLIIVITVYMLLDAPRISRVAASLLPPTSGVDQLFARMERALLRYTIGQSLASVVMGVSAFVGIWILGMTGVWEGAERYAVLFGVIVAITEFAPSIGPVIGSIPPIVTAAFDGYAPMIAVALFFLLLHQIEGHIVIPKLMGAAIAVHPLVVIFGILAGAQLMGIGGILLALPILAVGREVVLFIRERVAFASWSQPISVDGFGATLAGDVGSSEGGHGASTDTRSARRAAASKLRGWVVTRARARAGLDRRPDDE